MWWIFLRKAFFPLETKLAIVIPSQRHATGLSCTAEGGIALACRPRSYPDFPVTHASLSRARNSPKPQFSKIAKTNFNITVKPKGLITTHFFLKCFKIASSACIWTLNEACKRKQNNTCAWRYFLQVHVIQLIAPSPEVPQRAFTYGGNGKGRTISFLKHPMNCADT